MIASAVKTYFCCLLLLFLLVSIVCAQAPRIGDPGWTFDESRFDPRFPAMREWARAGVEGGIPLRRSLPIKKRLKPGDDLQAAMNPKRCAAPIGIGTRRIHDKRI